MSYCVRCMSEIEDSAVSCPYCGLSELVPAPEHHLAIGTVLNERYLVGMALGEGGFGITYVGRDLMLDMKVAIKEYYPVGYVNRNNTYSPAVTCSQNESRRDIYEKGREKFLTEARILAKFAGDPNVVTVRDFFELNNTAYIVMEYLEGQTLKSFINEQGAITADYALAILLPIMKSLCHVHAEGLIHRDISPDNIMIVNGNPKLLDFGAARDFTDDNHSMSIVLKRGYAPEEQYRSKGNQGPWTDVYAIAATLYRCITGFVPDESTERVREDNLRTPVEIGIEIDKHYESALMKALNIRAEDRFQSMDEFISELTDVAPKLLSKKKKKEKREKPKKEKLTKSKHEDQNQEVTKERVIEKIIIKEKRAQINWLRLILSLISKIAIIVLILYFLFELIPWWMEYINDFIGGSGLDNFLR